MRMILVFTLNVIIITIINIYYYFYLLILLFLLLFLFLFLFFYRSDCDQLRLREIQAHAAVHPLLVLVHKVVLLLVGADHRGALDGLVHALVDGAARLGGQALHLAARLAVDLLDPEIGGQDGHEDHEDHGQHGAGHEHGGEQVAAGAQQVLHGVLQVQVLEESKKSRRRDSKRGLFLHRNVKRYMKRYARLHAGHVGGEAVDDATAGRGI